MTYKTRIAIATKAIILSNELNLFDFMDSQEKTQNINDIYTHIIYTNTGYIKSMIQALKEIANESDLSLKTEILYKYVITELLLLTYGY